MISTPTQTLKTAQRGWTGVDVGSRSIKIAQLVRGRLGLKVENSLVISRSNAGLDGQFQWLTAEEIKKLVLACKQFSGSEIALTSSMSAGKFRVLELATSNEEEADALIQQQIRNEATVSHSYWAGLPSPDQPAQKVPWSLLSIPREFLDSLSYGFLKSELTCRVFDGLPFVLARMGLFSQAKTVLVVDWGYSSCTFQTAIRGEPGMTRTIRRGGFATLVKSVSQHCQIPLQQAEVLLRRSEVAPNLGRNSESPNFLNSLIAPALELFVAEFQKTLDFIKYRYPSQQPESILLTGGGATLPGIAASLSRQLNLPCSVPVISSSFSPSDETGDTQIPRRQAIFSTAASLSLLGMES